MIAAFVLLTMPDPALLADLRSDDAAVRLAAVQRVERRGADGEPDAAYLAPLAALLRDPDERTRGLAALALSRHVAACPESAPGELVVALLTGTRDGNRFVAGLCDRSFAALGVRAVPALSLPHTPRQLALSGYARLLADSACRERVDAVLWPLLDDADAQVRDRGLRMLVALHADHQLPPPRYLPRLVRLFETDGPARKLANEALIALKDDALPAVLEMVTSERPELRTAARHLLVRLLDEGVTPSPRQTEALVAIFRGTPEAEQLHGPVARALLARTPPRKGESERHDLALAALLDRPGHPEAVMGQLGTPTERAVVMSKLLDWLPNSDPARQRVLADLLCWCYRVGEEATPAALDGLLVAHLSRSVETRRAGARALSYAIRPGMKVPPMVIGYIGEGMGDRDRAVRVHSAYALAACGAQAEDALMKLLDAPNPVVVYHAVEAVTYMVHLHDQVPRRVLPQLDRLATQSANVEHLHVAVLQAAGAIRLAPQRPEGDAP
jgi:hypothetical protein